MIIPKPSLFTRKEFTGFLEKGGYLAWGIIPTSEAIADETPESIKKRFQQGIEKLSLHIPGDLHLVEHPAHPLVRNRLKDYRGDPEGIPASHEAERGIPVKGVFISFEGIEGTGKSTQANMLAEYLRQKDCRVIQTMEPGGTQISMKIRELLLSLESRGMDQVTELLLYNAARVQHIQEVVAPALRKRRHCYYRPVQRFHDRLSGFCAGNRPATD